MTDICEGCEGDKFCGIQDDIRHPDYKCPLPDIFKILKDKLEAIKKIAYSKRGLGSEMIGDIRKILEAEG